MKYVVTNIQLMYVVCYMLEIRNEKFRNKKFEIITNIQLVYVACYMLEIRNLEIRNYNKHSVIVYCMSHVRN